MPGFIKPGLIGLGPGRFLQVPPVGDSTPQVTSLTPATGRLSNEVTVTITGKNFQTNAIVTFGGVPAYNVVIVNSTTITCTAPVAGVTGAVDIVVTCGSQFGALYASFTYLVASIVSIEPAHGLLSGGTVVTIKGFNFQLGSTVKIGGIAATNVVFIDDQNIQCTTPAHATGFVDVEIVGP